MTTTRNRMPALIGLLALFFDAGVGRQIAAAEQKGAGKASRQVSEPAGNVETEYRVGPGDVIEISVWKEPELSSPSVAIRPDGKISLPLVNDLLVNGKTPMEIQVILTEKLEPYVKSPNVTVTVKEIRSKKVYVLGQVTRPGSYDVRQPVTILQILTEAGGPLPFAKQKSIYVLRNAGGKQQKLSFNYKEVLNGKKIEQNVQLQPGDTVVVP